MPLRLTTRLRAMRTTRLRNASFMGALLLLVVCSGCASFFQQRWNRRLIADQFVAVADQHAERGDAEKAARLLLQHLKQNPQDFRSHEKLVDCYRQSGRVELATQHLRQVVETRDAPPHLRIKLGQLYAEVENRDAALQQAQLAVGESPQCAEAWELMADVLGKGGPTDESLGAYHRALACDPHAERVQLKLAQAYLQIDRPLRALSTLEQLLSEQGGEQISDEMRLLYGQSLAAVNNHKMAVEQFQRLCERPVPVPESYLGLARSLCALGNTSQARQVLSDARQHHAANGPLRELQQQLKVDSPTETVASHVPF